MITKQKLAAVVAVALGSIASIPVHSATTTHNLNVQATINGNCRFNGTGGPTDLLIGTPLAAAGVIDQGEAPSNAVGTATVTYRCTTGTVAGTTADNGTHFSGSRRVCVGATTDCMPYAMNLVGGAQTGTGHGAGQDLTLTVNATIASADYVNAPAGVYTDVVVLTITP